MVGFIPQMSKIKIEKGQKPYKIVKKEKLNFQSE